MGEAITLLWLGGQHPVGCGTLQDPDVLIVVVVVVVVRIGAGKDVVRWHHNVDVLAAANGVPGV